MWKENRDCHRYSAGQTTSVEEERELRFQGNNESVGKVQTYHSPYFFIPDKW